MTDVPPPTPDEEPVAEDVSVPSDVETLEPADTSPDAASGERVAAVERERNQYLEALQRLQAEFENFRKRTVKQQTELLERAAETLVRELLPVLDIADLARSHGADDQVGAALFDVLHKEGLERLDPLNQAFDPSEHDAVMHEEGDGDGAGGEATVIDVMRAGYRWRGRLLRPAMVKVKGG